MRLIRPSFDVIHQSEGLEGVFKQIELAGRTCYKSEDKITDTSSKEFVDKMINLGHTAMLEHGTIYLKILHIDKYSCPLTKYKNNKYSKYKSLYADKDDVQGDITYYSDYYVTTNYRVLVENGWLDDLRYICEPTEYHEKRTTVKFICDRGVSHEFVRHRVFSFAQESTRYCNYSKDKFGNELTFIKPCFKAASSSEKDVYNHNIALQNLEYALIDAEKRYLSLLNLGWSPQQARTVLPNSLKTELVMTGFESDWNHFFELRCSPKAHPQAQELAIPLKLVFELAK